MTNNKNGSNQSVIYISHGGGPLPLLGDEAHQEMIANLKYIAATLTKPSAIIVISAHWEQNKPTITNAAQPALIYDYSGFPKESYAIQYAAPGEPLLATRLFEILRDNGIESVLDENRGFDHGVFVPLKIMYPDANIPCVQLSLVNSLSPIEHINIGIDRVRDGLRYNLRPPLGIWRQPSRYGLLSLRVTSPLEFTLMRFCTRMYLRGVVMDGQEPALANAGRTPEGVV